MTNDQDRFLHIKPQPGFQEKVFGCKADIAVIGGSNGGGKTMALIVETLKWVAAPEFAAVYFRRTMERIRATGGLLHESKKWYLEGELSETILKWRFPSGAQVDFEGIEHLKDLEKWRGTAIPLIIFDELTEFEEDMFWFMMSRNRGIVKWRDFDGNMRVLRPYVRASCNPKPNSWLSRLLEWWINQETGFPIDERDGVIRFFVRYKDKTYWGNTKDEVIASCPQVFELMQTIDPSINKYDLIKSFTFIRGKLSDNKILTQNSPEYYSSLLSMSEEDQKIFLEGNWKVLVNGTDLFTPLAIKNIFDFEPGESRNIQKEYIVIDAARFGQDLCTLYKFKDWNVVAISIFHLSSPMDIYKEAEYLRYSDGSSIPRSGVLVDQDGLGGDVVKLGKYMGFRARSFAAKDSDTRERENYFSFKDQCFFHAAEKVNSGECKIFIGQSNIRIFDAGASRPRIGFKIKCSGNLAKKYGAGMTDIRVIIQDQLNAIKKGETVFDGGESKYRINSKDEQKEILQGISPDFADPIGMRAYFDLERRRKGKSKCY